MTADVYARALLEAASDKAATVAEQLDGLAVLAEAKAPEWAQLLAPQVPSPALKATLAQLHVDALPIVRNFLALLVDKGRLAEFPDIHHAFRELVKLQQQQLDVKITTAVELPAELRTKLEERLSGSTGKQVTLHTSVDPSIIGGLVVQHGDRLVDTSLRSRLEQLRLQLKRPASSTQTENS